MHEYEMRYISWRCLLSVCSLFPSDSRGFCTRKCIVGQLHVGLFRQASRENRCIRSLYRQCNATFLFSFPWCQNGIDQNIRASEEIRHCKIKLPRWYSRYISFSFYFFLRCTYNIAYNTYCKKTLMMQHTLCKIDGYTIIYHVYTAFKRLKIQLKEEACNYKEPLSEIRKSIAVYARSIHKRGRLNTMTAVRLPFVH